jgi:hypothetical protein
VSIVAPKIMLASGWGKVGSGARAGEVIFGPRFD